MDAADFSQTWSAYVRRQLETHRDGLTNAQVGELIGASGAMVGNWLNAEGFKQASADKVISFWRRFGEGSTLPEALAAAGYASEEEFDTVIRTEPALEAVELDALLEEVRRRAETPPFGSLRAGEAVMTKPYSLREARAARATRRPSL